MIIIKYLLDTSSREIHKLDFMQDGDFLKPMWHLSDTVRIFDSIHIDTKKARLNKNLKDSFDDTHCTDVDGLEKLLYSYFETFDTEEEAGKRLNEMREE